jgi:hypothetical protein
MAKKEVELQCVIKHQTDKAWLINANDTDAWIPKSQISDYVEERDGTISAIFISEWLATEKGLI